PRAAEGPGAGGDPGGHHHRRARGEPRPPGRLSADHPQADPDPAAGERRPGAPAPVDPGAGAMTPGTGPGAGPGGSGSGAAAPGNPALAAEQQFRLLVESVQDYAIFMLDPAGHIATWNSGARSIKGYAPEEIIGQHFSVFYAAEDRAGRKPQ